MKNKKMKIGTFTMIGTISAIVLPVVVTVSCGSDPTPAPEVAGTLEGKVFKSTAPKVIDKKTFGTGNMVGNKLSPLGGKRYIKEYNERRATGKPFSLHYFIDDIKNGWKAGEDADDAFNVATIPLQNRELAGKILASQKDAQLELLGMLSKNTTDTMVGTTQKDYTDVRMISAWSKITSFVSWGGAADEGDFIVPKGNQVNAAHRNGVPLLGTLFISPGVNDPYNRIAKKNSDGSFPVADSMVKMASYFGFDGWFLNFEESSQTPPVMHEFMQYLHKKSEEAKLFTVLYDYVDGGDFMSKADGYPFSYAALDENTENKQSLLNKPWFSDMPKEKILAGFNFGQKGANPVEYNVTGDNLWLYAYTDRNKYDESDDEYMELFNGSYKHGFGVRDPRIENEDSQFTGLSKSHQEHTTITSRKKFSTSFELALGDKFYMNGEEQPLASYMAANGYRNPGIQDILPTYTWVNDQYTSATDFSKSTLKPVLSAANTIKGTFTDTGDDTGTPWITKIDHTGTPYYGDSNLHYVGKINANNSVVSKLYASHVALRTNDKFTIVSDNPKTKLALWTQDAYDASKVNDLVSAVISPEDNPETLPNGLFKLKYRVTKNLDKKIMGAFGLAFSNETSKTISTDYHIGNITFNPRIATPWLLPNTITSLEQGGDWSYDFGDKKAYNIRINWTMRDEAAIDHYIIWDTKTEEDNEFVKNKLLTVTALPAAYLQEMKNEKNINLVVDAMGSDNEIISSNEIIVQTSFGK